MQLLEVSTPEKEGPLLVSMLLKLPILFDETELRALFDDLKNHFSSLYIFPVSGIVEKGNESISLEDFLGKYGEYIQLLKNGQLPSSRLFARFFSSALTLCPKTLYAIDLKDGRSIIRPRRPIIQIQPHHFFYSEEDQSIRSMAFSQASITWGLQFSYPQIYQDSKTQEIFSLSQNDSFPNSKFFKHIQRWVRHNTLPTSFLINEKKITHSMRIGKNCFSWIEEHPQLKTIKVI